MTVLLGRFEVVCVPYTLIVVFYCALTSFRYEFIEIGSLLGYHPNTIDRYHCISSGCWLCVTLKVFIAERNEIHASA
jgi:hypothetical protein